MLRISVLIPLLAAAFVATPAQAAVKAGPAGAKFYTPPKTLPKGGHGTPIWARRLTGSEALKGASRNLLVLYKETGVNGKATAVSGAVTLPKGKAPKGGWPVITWAHGTTGIADRCAPTRANVLQGYDHPLLLRWLKAGYAIARTDYEGLGTPGAHPYLIGTSEGRSVLDVVRAARKLDPRVGKRVIISGHSQGGHAALWATALAKRWTPELSIRGTVAFAPASHLGEQGALLRSLTQPSGITGLAALILRGADTADAKLKLGSLMSPRAAALYPQTLTKCLGDLAKPSSFGALAPSELLRSDADINPLLKVLNANDPEVLTIRTPLLVEQGKADTTVFPAFTDQLVQAYQQRGETLTYHTYDNVDHGGVVTSAAADATAWIRD